METKGIIQLSSCRLPLIFRIFGHALATLKNMENITIYPKNEKQKSLLKSLLEEMNVRFEIVKSDNTRLNEGDFYAKIDKSIQQAENGELKVLTKEKQREFLGL